MELAERAHVLHQGQLGVHRLGVSLLTVAEVAKLLRVCTATVYTMVERGELEHVRVSNAIRVVVRGSGGAGKDGGQKDSRRGTRKSVKERKS